MIITFEGIDGVGKSSQIHGLAAWLEYYHSRRVTVVRNPGDSVISPLPLHAKISISTHMLHRMCILRNLTDKIIKPAVADGSGIVLLDRGWGSMVAYQGAARAEEDQYPYALRVAKNNTTLRVFKAPTILLDAPPAVAIQRCKAEDQPLYDRDNGDYMHRVHGNYHRLAQLSHWAVIDATQPEAMVHIAVTRQVSAWLGLS